MVTKNAINMPMQKQYINTRSTILLQYSVSHFLQLHGHVVVQLLLMIMAHPRLILNIL